MNTANGRLTLNTQKMQIIILNCILSAGVFLSSLFIMSVSAAGLYDLRVPAVKTVNSPDTTSYRFNFRYREETGVTRRLNNEDEILGVKSFSESELLTENNLEQYDATIYYAGDDQGKFSRHPWLSFDLGVNLKFIEQTYDSTRQAQKSSKTHYGAYPMVAATAQFVLPFSGMTASLEGSYYNYNTRELSEYRAILTYQIDNVFGVSGGWEQQQYQLDATDRLEFDKEGPFVDLFYKF
ncbi:MAG: hypothetical protein ACC657_15855 [Thiohalomonadales bacterium]